MWKYREVFGGFIVAILLAAVICTIAMVVNHGR